ncbi:MAG: carboxypeptidase-like regulatory domain-containing protein [Bacteroidetes bacterium]|nr:carboxypeptidase-like regulatory domain-containing protein [Bacteroidota bacterium]
MTNLAKLSAGLFFMLTFTVVEAASPSLLNRKIQDPQSVITIKGKVIDAETRNPLIFATITVQGTNVATVTNLDGEFILKIASTLSNPSIEVLYIGYENRIILISDLRDGGRKNTIELKQTIIPIREVVIKSITPEEIITQVIVKVPDNYAGIPNLMTSFYRETIKKNKNYVSIAEAVIEIFKAPYNNVFRNDMARVYKGRKNVEVTKFDTVLFRLQGGPTTTLQLDLIKNPYSILTLEAMSSYDYKLVNIVVIDEMPHYVIEFHQKPDIDMPLFFGRLFIEMETFALTEAAFSMNIEDKIKASQIFIRKKPVGMKVIPVMTSYRVKFREQEGKWYFTYSRAEVKVKVKWKKKLFNPSYTIMSEIAITDRTEEEVIKFNSRERLKMGDIFTQQLSAFADPDFWGDYNVIEPDQTIESAIRRLNRKLKFSDRKGK